MSYDLELLKKEFSSYKKKHHISIPQINYIKSLYKDYLTFDGNLQSLEALIEDILTQDIEENDINNEEIILVENLTNYQAGIVIEAFNKKILPLQRRHAKRITEHLNFQELSTILKKPINSINDINRKDYFILVNNPNYNFSYCLSHFNLKCKDIVITSQLDYEYGYQVTDICENDKLYYIKFYNLLTLDYDNISLDEIKQLLEEHFPNNDNVVFYIYQTYAGYHLYYMTNPLSHTDPISCHFMKTLKCDLWYILFSHKNGFKIRLSKKKGRGETDVETFIEKWGNGTIHQRCRDDINMLNQYLFNMTHDIVDTISKVV